MSISQRDPSTVAPSVDACANISTSFFRTCIRGGGNVGMQCTGQVAGGKLCHVSKLYVIRGGRTLVAEYTQHVRLRDTQFKSGVVLFVGDFASPVRLARRDVTRQK